MHILTIKKKKNFSRRKTFHPLVLYMGNITYLQTIKSNIKTLAQKT